MTSAFPPAAMVEWIADGESQSQQTALCPYCSNDSVIGSSSTPQIDFYLPRIETALLKHHAKNCYPERTWYAA
jgi:hypothetical protein